MSQNGPKLIGLAPSPMYEDEALQTCPSQPNLLQATPLDKADAFVGRQGPTRSESQTEGKYKAWYPTS